MVPIRRRGPSDTNLSSDSEDSEAEYVPRVMGSDEDSDGFLQDNLGTIGTIVESDDEDEDVIVEHSTDATNREDDVDMLGINDILASARARAELDDVWGNNRPRRSTFSEDFTQNGPSSSPSTNSNTTASIPTTVSDNFRAVPAIMTGPNGVRLQLVGLGGYPVVDIEPITPPASEPASESATLSTANSNQPVERPLSFRDFEEHSRLRRMENAEERNDEVQFLINAMRTSDAIRGATTARLPTLTTSTFTSNSNSVIACPEPSAFNSIPTSATLAEAAASRQRNIARLPSSTTISSDTSSSVATNSSNTHNSDMAVRRDARRERVRRADTLNEDR